MGFKSTFEFTQKSDDACYLRMPDAPRGSGCVETTRETDDGPYMINFDYDKNGRLIGIEVVKLD